MGLLKLFFVISLVLSLLRPYTASPRMGIWHDAALENNPQHTASYMATLQDFKHKPFAQVHTHADSYEFIGPGKLPANLQPSPPTDRFFSKNPTLEELADHHILWIKSLKSKRLDFTTSPHSWFHDAKIYRSLPKEDKNALEIYLDAYVITSDKEKHIAKEINWLMRSEPTWWDKTFVENNFENQQYQKLVAIGDLLKFHEKNPNVKTLSEKYITKTLHPGLQEILISDKKIKSTPLNLKSLLEIQDRSNNPIYVNRIRELEGSIFPNLEDGNEMMEILKRALVVNRRMKSMSHMIPNTRSP